MARERRGLARIGAMRGRAAVQPDLAESMRVLHIISSLDPATGGPAAAVRFLLTHGPNEYLQEVVTLDGEPCGPTGTRALRSPDFPDEVISSLWTN